MYVHTHTSYSTHTHTHAHIHSSIYYVVCMCVLLYYYYYTALQIVRHTGASVLAGDRDLASTFARQISTTKFDKFTNL